MPRTPRIKSKTGIYHIMLRGINHQKIFDDVIDKCKMLDIMQNIVNPSSSSPKLQEPDCEIYAYALMDNHIHILIKVLKDDIGNIIKRIAGSYVIYYNWRHNRDGHLFKERFKSEVCEDDEYLITLFRYIHQNPLKARIVTNLLDFKYTSWMEYVAPEKSQWSICNKEPILEKVATYDLNDIVYNLLSDDSKYLDIDEPRGIGMIDDQIILYLKNNYDIELSIWKSLDRKTRNSIITDLLKRGCGIRQLERVLGVDKSIIGRINAKISKKKE